jgi:Beta-lactamase
VVDGKPVVRPEFYRLPRGVNPAGGLISSARDQLRYARFHLGDGTVPGGGARLLTRRSLLAMRSRPGPGGTLLVELDGMGVTWMLRPSAQGTRIVQHGGDLPGQHSGFLLVPAQGFALTLLTNSEGGPALVAELFADDWALRLFTGLRNLPARPRPLAPRELAAYEGTYTLQQIGSDGVPQEIVVELSGDRGQLVATLGGVVALRLVFYRPDYVLVLDPTGGQTGQRADFLRDASGRAGGVAAVRRAAVAARGGRRPVRRPARARVAADVPLPAVARRPGAPGQHEVHRRRSSDRKLAHVRLAHLPDGYLATRVPYIGRVI